MVQSSDAQVIYVVLVKRLVQHRYPTRAELRSEALMLGQRGGRERHRVQHSLKLDCDGL